MKKILLFFLLSPIVLSAQKLVPRFENDTLYTTSGYKIYEGQILTFAEGTGKKGNFRYINIKGGISDSKLTNMSVVVKQLSNFTISALGNGYIRILASITYEDGSSGEINFNMAFDRAIESFPGLPSELVVPDEFKAKKKSVADEISKLYKLYQDSILTKQEFETQKKKLLDQ